ncbi:hypothetical protein SKAU_G00368420 [Synaphobranchus kaupii]|uniref:Uncharacterized protein n=1 Tax=Synaphobranchus kaupii TaxID=118154 RepID=A0A9Q1IFQ7_SYNKA|nr:hypothetical protein SKAU_G00368420 [Synaphobranchus kaupii]
MQPGRSGHCGPNGSVVPTETDVRSSRHGEPGAKGLAAPGKWRIEDGNKRKHLTWPRNGEVRGRSQVDKQSRAWISRAHQSVRLIRYWREAKAVGSCFDCVKSERETAGGGGQQSQAAVFRGVAFRAPSPRVARISRDGPAAIPAAAGSGEVIACQASLPRSAGGRCRRRARSEARRVGGRWGAVRCFDSSSLKHIKAARSGRCIVVGGM